ncbi:MAG TPA: hypothetical protein PL048_16040 [Leptospiraceae bacterium]|nr:hypothetical protein [Leptospiraceae bacterium]HMY65590.1 hypothetical protein [Leptospiraceae bacterium]HMZ60288.1 hypothetical protein [Leptospiraceae bacterium]HNF16069.1 hypothetical protein [Leptospiraceae bacterium]HNF25976.1 hypothetical protein [Leptospiraceae bacterium]
MKIILTLFLMLISFSSAVSEKVYVGIYVVNLGKFEVATGSFTADFYMTLKTEKEAEFPLDSFEFMNGRAVSSEKILEEPNLVQYRIMANLTNPVDLRKFPFDDQILSIIIENKKYTSDKVKYVIVDRDSGLDEMIAFAGWNIRGWKAEERDHIYKVFNETYSLASFNIQIEKIRWNAFFKTFLPVLIIIFLVNCSFIMDTDKIKDRLGICTSGLVASVMFHLSISNQIPAVSYLTIADKFMLHTYIVLLMCVLLNVFMLQLIQVRNEDITQKIHRFTKYGMFIVIPAIYMLFFAVNLTD